MNTEREDWTPDFHCHVCGCDCPTCPPPPGKAVCEEHCEDHDYEYDRDERGHHCRHCFKIQPYESGEDDVPLFTREPGQPLGVPLSQVTGSMLDRMAEEWRFS
jgi:hypothetical protein